MSHRPSMNYKDFTRLLTCFGFHFVSSEGSHHKFVDESQKHQVVVPKHGNDTFKKGLLSGMFRDAGLTDVWQKLCNGAALRQIIKHPQPSL